MTTIYECIKNYVPLFCESIFPFGHPGLDPGSRHTIRLRPKFAAVTLDSRFRGNDYNLWMHQELRSFVLCIHIPICHPGLDPGSRGNP